MSNLQIIMYHYVRDLENSRYPRIRGLSADNFLKQIDFLSNQFSFVTPQDVIESYYGGKKLVDNACFLTFDDGYIDHYDMVFPVLANRGIKAFFSMPGRIIKEEKLLDVNKIHYIMAAASPDVLWEAFKKQLHIRLSENNLPTFEEYWKNCNLESRYDPPEVIFMKRMLQVELPMHLRNELVDNLYCEFVNVPENVLVKELYMSPEQMKMMKSAGMVFGIHGYEHAWLNRMTQSKAEMDIEMALDVMDGIVDRQGWIMCYPYGSHSNEVEEIAKKKGAILGVTTKCAAANLERDNAFTLPRLDTNDFPPISCNYETLQQ